jgi:hypothetical protein
MQVRNVDVVAPAHQAVTDVAHERTGRGGDADPRAVARAQFEPAGIVLREERDVTVVGVRRRAVQRAVERSRMRWIVEQPRDRDRAVEGRREEAFVDAEIERDRTVNGDRQREQPGVVAFERRLKAR